jgi:hypothetical protein
MTIQEHLLIITMLSRQERYIYALERILVGRNCITEGDMKAVDDLILQRELDDSAMLRRTAKAYIAMMAVAGMDIPSEISDIAK